ncbi:IclR family transcriptional regulator [Falsiroseomonas selenitidurans]|uniref:IclR family transcriptional regulator n=1 Tax=Falsiroseomonas selenitidurans TaxID=2716335 RepID=A0ABX1E3A6_9PROT|nr:IclR family transcriptional regulator [Falsiroseomonas selenitidurans]NKC31243.1 IclR family transcriptional regulator [Falsiroseomonas selenitidurans]
MPRIDGPPRGEGLQAVAIAFEILEYLAAQRGGVGVSDLARALGTTKSRVHRHLRTLLACGYIVQNAASEKYGVGSRLVTLGRTVAEHFDLASIARETLHELRDRLGQSVVISRADPAGAVVLATLPGREAIEIVVKPGSLMALHCTAQGKLTLAHADAALRERVLLSRLDLRTRHTITDPEVLRAELARIQARGWATAPGESMEGVNALAAPIFDGGGEMVGAVAILGSIQFIAAEPAEGQIRQLRQAAAAISARLGHRDAAGR